MATLEEALQGLNVTGGQTGYGIATQALGQMTPQLINPYGSTGQAIGISLGSILLQSLLGYQARSQAAQETLQLNTLANQMQELSTPQARTDFIGGLEDPMQQSRLSTLATALTAQEAARKAKAADKLLELQTGAEFEFSPLGEKLFKRKQEAELAQIIANKKAVEGKDAWESIGKEDQTKLVTAKGQIAELRDLAKTFQSLDLSALSKGIAELNPSSETAMAIARMNILVPTTARLMGEVGNLAQPEQERLIKSTLGDLRSGTQSIAKRLNQLANSANNIIENKLKTYEIASKYGIAGVLADLQTTKNTATTPLTTDTAPTVSTVNNSISRLQAVASNPAASEATKAAALAEINKLLGQ